MCVSMMMPMPIVIVSSVPVIMRTEQQTCQPDGHPDQHGDHFPAVEMMMVFRTRFEQDGRGNVQEDTDHHRHHPVKVLFDISDIPRTDALAQ